jgi:uncharacterized protein
MSISDELIQEIVRRILSVSNPVKIILFGSAATGQMTKDSDIDLLVLESEVKNENDEFVRIRQSLRGLGFAFDVIILAAEYFESSKDIVGGLAYPVNKYGKVIYAA